MMLIARPVTLDEFVQIIACHSALLKGEMLVCPQVIEPYFLGPWVLTRGLAIKENDISLNSLSIKDPSRQSQDGMKITFMHKLPADCLTSVSFKQHNRGYTALMCAAWGNKNPEVLRVLLEAGAYVNGRT